MTCNRRSRCITIAVALCALLFGQLALAGYRCPDAAAPVVAQAAAHAGMPCAQDMTGAVDDEQPALCMAHCQDQQQRADSYQLPDICPAPATGHVVAVASEPLHNALQALPLRLHPTGPPLALLHCCLRF